MAEHKVVQVGEDADDPESFAIRNDPPAEPVKPKKPKKPEDREG